MALATRCPHCQTTFRVANDQLKLHSGLVRCGACQQTFNGVEHLISMDGAKASNASPSRSVETPPSDTVQLSHAAADESTPKTPAPLATATDAETGISNAAHEAEPAVPDEAFASLPDTAEIAAETLSEDAPHSSSAIDFDLGDTELAQELSEASPETVAAKLELETRAALLSEPDIDWSHAENAAADPEQAEQIPPMSSLLSATASAVPESAPESESAAVFSEPYIGEAETALEQRAGDESVSINDADDEHKPEFVLKAEREQQRGRTVRIAMLLAICLLLPLLAAQFSYIFRVALAANFPSTRPALTQACTLLHCTLGLPAQLEQITLESNELQEQSPGKNVFSLSIQLQNHSNLTQAWPHIELVLNDKKDKAVLQKAFAASEYLSSKSEIAQGFAANSDKNIKIYFQLPKLSAAGYHVGIFYP